MNKIYKVIWSKVRNCYVAVSEIAKRNGKSCTCVNCEAKRSSGRSLRMAAVTLGVAAALVGSVGFSTPVAWAEGGTITVRDANDPQTYADDKTTGGTLASYNSNGGNIFYYPVEESITTLEITGGVATTKSFTGGYATGTVAVTGHTVAVSGSETKVKYAYGGWATGDGAASNNIVKFSGGASADSDVIGARTSEGAARNNEVAIDGGTFGWVTGAYSFNGDTGGTESREDGNKVTIAAGKVTGNVSGGITYNGSANYNTVSIGQDTEGTTSVGTVYGGCVYYGSGTEDTANGNKVDIKGKTTAGDVYGGYMDNGSGGVTTTDNIVTISGNTTVGWVIGGYSSIARGNQVTIQSDDTTKSDVPTIKVTGPVIGGDGAISGGKTEDKEHGNIVRISGKNIEISGGRNIGDKSREGSVYGGYASNGIGEATYNQVEISNGVTVKYPVLGGYGTYYASYNQVKITDDVTVASVKGGSTLNGSANGNVVTIDDSTVGGDVYGGYIYQSPSTENAGDNIVAISGTALNGNVYGGYAITYNSNGATNNNTVTIGDGVTVGSDSVEIVGGRAKSVANNNTVNLAGTSALAGASLYGASVSGNGNELHIGRNVKYDSDRNVVVGTDGKPAYESNENTAWQGKTGETISNKVNRISNFNTVALHAVKWNPNVAVLEAAYSSNIGELDISDMTIYGSINAGESMNLLKSGDYFSGIQLKYKDGETVKTTTDGIGTGVSFDSKPYSEAAVNGVKLTGTEGKTVKLVENNKAIQYSYATSITGVSLENMTWGTARDLEGAFTFGSDATIDAAKLTFTGTVTTLLKNGDGMDLVTNATGIEAVPTSKITQPDTGKGTVGISYTDAAGVKYGATASGNVTTATDTVKYTVNKVEVSSIDLTGWGGTKASTVPEGWVKGSALSVNTGSATIGLAAGASVLSSDTALFSGATFTGNNQYTASAFTPSTEKGVKLDGTQSKGIKASADGKSLIYAADSKKNVTTITLGTVNTKDPRDMSGTDFDFTNTAKVDASGLKLEIAQPVDTTKRTIPLVTNAANLKDNVAVDYGTGKENHTQNVDLTHDATGIALNATVAGLVATKDSTVNYNVTGVTLNSLNLDKWNGKSASEDLTGLKHIDGGVSVDTGSFAAPTDLAAGEARVIVTASSGFFDDTKITGANTYGEGDSFTETDQPGATLAGTKVGGVKAEDSGAKLTYYAMAKTGKNLVLGEATFVADGRLASYGSAYDLTATDINADGLKFTGGTDAMKPNASMTVVDATDAKKGTGGATLAFFASKTYEVDFTDPIEGKALTLTGKHTDTLTQDTAKTKLTYTVGEKKVETAAFTGTVNWNPDAAYHENTGYTFSDATKIDASKLSMAGNVTTALAPGESMTLLSAAGLKETNSVTQPTAAGSIGVAYETQGVALHANATGEVKAAANAVKYEVTGVALNSTDLAGWNGSAAASVPTGWTLASGATIETDGMTAPDVEAGNHVDIVKSDADGFFASATINGANKYKAVSFNEKDGGITFKGSQSKGVTLNEEKNHIIYASGTKDVATATVTGTIAWDTGKVYYENTKYTFGDTSKTDISGVKFTADTDPLNQSMTLITNAAGAVTAGTPQFNVALQNTRLGATAAGTAAIDSGGNLKYTVTGVTLDKVSVSGVGSDAVPEGWSVSPNVAVDTGSMTVPTDVAAGEEKAILTASGANVFSEENITGSNAYKESKFTENSEKASDTKKGVTVSGTQGKGVTVGDEGKSLVYKVGKKEADAVTLGAVDWKKGETLFDGSSATEYDYANVTAVDAGKFDVTYASPETVAAGESMTLLKANATLKAIVDEEKTKAYSFAPVSGVTVDAAITGRLANSGNNVVFTAAENKASKLTFGDVEWKNSGALMARPSNIIFAGADVDTSKINFYKEIYLDADQKMTLVSDFGDKVGTITGSKYRVGTAFEGEGEASLSGSDLIFTTKTSAGVSEQTHKAVMAAEVGVAALNVGSDYIGKALESMGDLANVAPDGTTVGAAIGGGRNRYETGSHVNVNSWNAAVAVGAKRELKNGSLEYGLFGEYGKANYTLHSEVGQSDGDTHYAGGGLMAKWTNKHDVYTEVSFRLGRMSDSTNDLLRDGAGNAYGYDIHANYFGAHVGLGKIVKYKGGKSLDVYGKYFYTKRDGVEFDAVQHYNLDSVKSSILRIGARYGTTDKKWNWYGGLAYEYEFDGESKGTVKDTAIRAASIKGSSVRGEIGMKMNATKTNPWQVDVSLYGYGGKHRGFGGNVNVAYLF